MDGRRVCKALKLQNEFIWKASLLLQIISCRQPYTCVRQEAAVREAEQQILVTQVIASVKEKLTDPKLVSLLFYHNNKLFLNLAFDITGQHG